METDPIIIDPDDEVILPPATPPVETKVILPSNLGMEAWKNVEELLIGLSANLRSSNEQLRNDIKELVESGRLTNSQLVEAVKNVNSAIQNLIELVENATIEVPEQKDDEPVLKKGNSFLSRKKK